MNREEIIDDVAGIIYLSFPENCINDGRQFDDMPEEYKKKARKTIIHIVEMSKIKKLRKNYGGN